MDMPKPDKLLLKPIYSGNAPHIPAAENTPIYSPPAFNYRTRPTGLCSYPDSTKITRYGVAAAVECLIYGGYRIADILNTCWKDVLSGDRVLIRASKHGSASICPLKNVSKVLLSIPPLDRFKPIFSCTYSQVYTYMLRTGFRTQPAGHKNASVTHTPRRSMAVAAFDIAGATAAGQVLNHVSKSTIEYYLPPHTIFPQCVLLTPPNGWEFVGGSPEPPLILYCFLRLESPRHAVSYWLQYSENPDCSAGEDKLLMGINAVWDTVYTFNGPQDVYWKYRAIFDSNGRTSRKKGPWSLIWKFSLKYPA